jgi:hypothetical protein
MEGSMALTYEEVLEKKYKIRDNYLELIDLITLQPKPNYNIDNQEVSWADYLKLLQSNLAAIEAQINLLAPIVEAEENGYC